MGGRTTKLSAAGAKRLGLTAPNLLASAGALTGMYYNIIVVTMIPNLIPLSGSPWSVLPPGVHNTTLQEIEASFATNRRRRWLFGGLVVAAGRLRNAGCGTIYLDGSFVTAKPIPKDYDACWDPTGVNPRRLDPVFRDFRNGRQTQKVAFQGEFFPSTTTETSSGRTFVEFFQVDRFTGGAKGILSISLVTDPLLARRTP